MSYEKLRIIIVALLGPAFVALFPFVAFLGYLYLTADPPNVSDPFHEELPFVEWVLAGAGIVLFDTCVVIPSVMATLFLLISKSTSGAG